MNSQSKFYKLLLLLVVLILFGISAILPDIESAERLARRYNVHLAPVADKRADPAKHLNAKDREQVESDNAEENEHGTDRPDEALRFRRMQMQDEKGFIPLDGLEKARQHVKQMKVARQSPIMPTSWDWLGPGNIGGRIRSIAIAPNNANNMWVGSVGGGIWRTTSAGSSWSPVDDFMANLAVSSIVITPGNTSTMYAGTGESFNAGNPPGSGLSPDGLQGAGIFISPDSGLTWNRLPATNPAAAPVPGCGIVGGTPCPQFWLFVNRLAVASTANGIMLLAATGGGLARSPNGGQTWFQTTTAQALDVRIDPANSNNAVAGELAAVRRSTDGGQTWTPQAVGPPLPAPQPVTFTPAITNGGTSGTNGRVELSYAPSNTSIVYASVNNNNGALYLSTNSGQDFTLANGITNYLIGTGPTASNQGWYDNALWVNPQDPTFVIVGGIDLWRSTSSGMSFTKISDWTQAPASSAHADHHVIVAHPGFNNTSNRIVYFGNDGGIYQTNDVQAVQQTSGWTNLNNLLGITQFYGGAGSFRNGNPVIIGGAQDNGTVSSLCPGCGLFQWTPVPETGVGGIGDGGYCAADPTDSNYFYTEGVNLRIYRSTNGSASLSRIDAGIVDANSGNSSNFISPFVLDPSSSNVMLAGGMSLWRSTNVRDTDVPVAWAPIKGPIGANAQFCPLCISAIGVSPVSSNLIVVGHNNGNIYRTFNGTATSPTWDPVNRPGMPGRVVTRLMIDFTRNWIYATFGGFNADNVYRTTDSGATWTAVVGTGTNSLPSVPIRSIVLHPRDPNLLFVGTEMGIFTSDDAGATWSIVQGGPANVSVDELFWMGGDLIAATHGRGIYRASGGIYVDCTYGGISDGSFDRPYRTVTEALNAATVYRTIWLKTCNYNEQMTINKINGVELRSLGNPSAVGRP